MGIKPKLMVLFTAVVLASGCASWGESPDPVSGDWTGAWYRAGEREPAGALRCHMEPVEKNRWQARFETQAGVEVTYEFRLDGRRAGRRVLFDGAVDLGTAGGGVYEWKGEADGEVFQGTFEHPAGDGRFEMVRLTPAATVPDQE